MTDIVRRQLAQSIETMSKVLADDTIHIQLKGTAGQSFGAFLAKGVTLDLVGGSSYIWHWKHAHYHHTYVNIDDGWQGPRGGKHNGIQPIQLACLRANAINC